MSGDQIARPTQDPSPGVVQVAVPLALSEACASLAQAAKVERVAKVWLDDAILAARDAGLSLLEMAELMGITKSAVAQRVGRLERKRFGQ